MTSTNKARSEQLMRRLLGQPEPEQPDTAGPPAGAAEPPPTPRREPAAVETLGSGFGGEPAEFDANTWFRDFREARRTRDQDR